MEAFAIFELVGCGKDCAEFELVEGTPHSEYSEAFTGTTMGFRAEERTVKISCDIDHVVSPGGQF